MFSILELFILPWCCWVSSRPGTAQAGLCSAALPEKRWEKKRGGKNRDNSGDSHRDLAPDGELGCCRALGEFG